MDFQAVIKRLGTICLSALLLTGCGQRETEEVEIGWVGIANIDHFLAASRLIEGMGVPASSYPVIPEMPPPTDAMVFIPAANLQTQGRLNTIDSWVHEGGTAVVMLTTDEEASLWGDLEESPINAFAEYEGLSFEHEVNRGRRVTTLDTMENDHLKSSYETDFYNQITFRSSGYAEDPQIYMGYDYGEGSLHVISAGSIFTNEELMKAEHATFLWDLVKSENPREVMFVFSSDISFFKLLWSKYSYAIIALVVLLIVWLWYSARRFGPIFKTINPDQNKLTEHLTATGYFFSSHKADELIVAQVREELRVVLARRVNLPIYSDYNEVIKACKKQNVLDPAELTILTSPIPDKAADRLQYIQQLQSINR